MLPLSRFSARAPRLPPSQPKPKPKPSASPSRPGRCYAGPFVWRGICSWRASCSLSSGARPMGRTPRRPGSGWWGEVAGGLGGWWEDICGLGRLASYSLNWNLWAPPVGILCQLPQVEVNRHKCPRQVFVFFVSMCLVFLVSGLRPALGMSKRARNHPTPHFLNTS